MSRYRIDLDTNDGLYAAELGEKKRDTRNNDPHVSNLEDWLGLYFIIFVFGFKSTFFLGKALDNINAEVKAIRELLERAIKDKHDNRSDDEWIAPESAKLEAKFRHSRKLPIRKKT